ncbi:unnamed protein product [Medioppia subpectinata]|uniref:BolA-like protein 3 n=1 Tax=Medioppia subpectinata TaxID=1979941 RepID=A0A7R9QCR8_9ACAR|nr:unnamed protein product [Medioppia subpectinata]CAD7650018.1 unnamed protein product [Medioppia subpectinata]CAG2118527.1 unnamed protein product [Medioppia subpectinata]CAG2122715.1 unnamed protein product [Medioppia subpectinata]
MSFKSLYSKLWRNSYHVFRSVSQITTKPETRISDILRREFPKATEIVVNDISGGCGAMFEIHLKAEEFNGLNTVKQHMKVNDVLKNEIKDMHGIRIYTQPVVPSK